MSSRRRAFTPIQLAAAFMVSASLVAIAVPAFYKNLHASRLVEPVSGLQRIGAGAVAFAEAHGGAMPPTSPLTPETPPRATLREDPVGTWEQPGWLALHFEPTENGAPHAFNFGFENRTKLFVGTAHGDLDGDGVVSTFEVRGTRRESSVVLDPGMYVADEFE